MLKRHFTAPIRSILPIEWLVLWGCFVAIGMMVVSDCPLLLPAPEMGEVTQMLTVTQKYSTLIGSIFCLYFLGVVSMGLIKGSLSIARLLCDVCIFLRLLICLAFGIYLMQSFKWWSQMQTVLYDDFYWQIDTLLYPVKAFILSSEEWLKTPQIWYFYGFSYFFMIPYLVSILIIPDMFLKLMSANIAVMILGGIAYGIAPANGPLVYGLASDPLMAETQQHMLDATKLFRDSQFKFSPADFDAVLGAMPSLHVAHITAIVMVIFGYSRIIAMLCIPPLLFIFAYSIVTHFHYLIDIPAGLALAFISVRLIGIKYPSDAEKEEVYLPANNSL